MLRTAFLSASLVLAVFLGASVLGSYVALAGNRAPLPVPATRIGPSYENVNFRSRVDRIPLSGWLFRSPARTGRSIILVHGWGGNREDADFDPLARQFLAEGFDVLMFDMRGSGRSGGSNETLATDEPRDLLGAYDFMRARGYQPSRMAILGNSMGAATVIEAAPELSAVAALICDSSFTSVSAAVESAFTHYTKLPGALAWPTLVSARLWGVNPSVSPIDVVRRLPHRAFLFIQSRGDNLIPTTSAEQLRAASKDPDSRILLIDSHAHLDTYRAYPGLFMNTVNSFIAEQMALQRA